MDAALSIALGYFVGSLSPSSLVGRVKKTDVRKSGTGNLAPPTPRWFSAGARGFSSCFLT